MEQKEKNMQRGLFIIRVGIGIMFILHGYPKLMAGPATWQKIGGAMGIFGMHMYPQFWGLMAALSEAVGGLLLILGVWVRPACFFMLITMIVAASMHLANGQGFNAASHAIEAGIVFLGIAIMGAGAYTLPSLFKRTD